MSSRLRSGPQLLLAWAQTLAYELGHGSQAHTGPCQASLPLKGKHIKVRVPMGALKGKAQRQKKHQSKEGKSTPSGHQKVQAKPQLRQDGKRRADDQASKEEARRKERCWQCQQHTGWRKNRKEGKEGEEEAKPRTKPQPRREQRRGRKEGTPKKGGSPQASNRKESSTRRGRKGREHVVPFARLALPTLHPRWPDWRISVSVEVVGRAAESHAPLPRLFNCRRGGGRKR